MKSRCSTRTYSERINDFLPVIIRLQDYATALNQDITLGLREFALNVISQTDPQIPSGS